MTSKLFWVVGLGADADNLRRLTRRHCPTCNRFIFGLENGAGGNVQQGSQGAAIAVVARIMQVRSFYGMRIRGSELGFYRGRHGRFSWYDADSFISGNGYAPFQTFRVKIGFSLPMANRDSVSK